MSVRGPGGRGKLLARGIARCENRRHCGAAARQRSPAAPKSISVRFPVASRMMLADGVTMGNHVMDCFSPSSNGLRMRSNAGAGEIHRAGCVDRAFAHPSSIDVGGTVGRGKSNTRTTAGCGRAFASVRAHREKTRGPRRFSTTSSRQHDRVVRFAKRQRGRQYSLVATSCAGSRGLGRCCWALAQNRDHHVPAAGTSGQCRRKFSLLRSYLGIGWPPAQRPVRFSSTQSNREQNSAKKPLERALCPARVVGPGSSSRPDHTLKELPQPQDEVAFGFLTWNEEPTISST